MIKCGENSEKQKIDIVYRKDISQCALWLTEKEDSNV